MSVLQPISYGLVHQVGPGTGGRGFGSYKADNTELIRPYQQESSSPIGRGYPMSVVSGAPTVYDPRAGIQEDPIVMLLKQLLGKKTPVQKAPDAGFRSNEQVYPTSGQALELPGRTLGAKPASLNSENTSYNTADGSSTKSLSAIDYSGLGSSSKKSFDESWSEWIADLGDALNGSDYEGLEKSVSSNRFNQRELDIIQTLDDILLETRVLNLDSESAMGRRFKSINDYYAGLAALTGEYTFGQAYQMLLDSDNLVLDRERILQAVKDRGIDVAAAVEGSATSSGSSMSIDNASYRSSSSMSNDDASYRSGSSMSIDNASYRSGSSTDKKFGFTFTQPSSSSSRKSSTGYSSSSFAPSNDGRKEKGRRSSPVNTRSKKKGGLVLNSM